MRIAELIKNSGDFNAFLREVRTESLSQAYLISSDDKVALETFCELAIKSLFCSAEIAPCENCLNCRKVANRTELDVMYFGEGDGIVKKDEIQKLITEILTKPFENEKKVIVINNADNMNIASQNMLLKILEELPDYLYLFMLAKNDLTILQTIKSRVRKISLHSFKNEEILELCNGENKSNVVLAANGNLGRAMHFCEDKNFGTYFNFALTLAQNYTKSSLFTQKVAFFIKNKANYEDLLVIMESVFYLALRKEIVCDCSEMAIIKIISAINDCSSKLKTNANFSAMVDALFMKILEEKNKWKE